MFCRFAAGVRALHVSVILINDCILSLFWNFRKTCLDKMVNADLDTFTEETLNEKLHILCIVTTKGFEMRTSCILNSSVVT